MLSRREFLIFSSLGVLSLFLPPAGDPGSPLSDQLGRVIDSKISLYDIPSFNGREVKVYWKDMVFPITEVTVGDYQPAHNRIWYRFGEDGYVHSGVIQPVKTVLNPAVDSIPEGGTLAEVTVPFTDAHWGPGKQYPFAYRFYYETTYWVLDRLDDVQNMPWYRILDDKWEVYLYIPAQHLRLVSEDELSPLSPDVPPEAKRLEVRRSDQLVIAYEWDHPVFMARASTGAKFSNGSYLTPIGQFTTFHKRPSRHMARGNLAANGYDLPGVPWISYITESGIAFHGTYWHNDYGRPRSHGCINLPPWASKWIYRWTLPVVPPDQQRVYNDFGTRVDIVS